MKFFLIERNDKVDYDEYDSCVVVAETPEQAKQMIIDFYGTGDWNGWKDYDVTITEIKPDHARIVLPSFKAG
jgi:hypothetical protein